jgi:hypothetical protein
MTPYQWMENPPIRTRTGLTSIVMIAVMYALGQWLLAAVTGSTRLPYGELSDRR